MNNPVGYWPRIIVHVDMNAFFASVEQLDNPLLRGQPIGITNGDQGTCIITCSYEARAYGIKTGMRVKEALALCPHFKSIPSNPHRYAEISTKIMLALQNITPDIEIFSIDEAFLDVTRCEKLLGTPETIGKKVKELIFNISGLLCSIGVSHNKTMAKFAAKLQKPNGFTIIYPWEAKERLKNVPVTELCGIAKGTARFLASYGVTTCGDMAKLPIGILAKRFGNVGRRIWYMCQGEDPEPLHRVIPTPKSLGHGKVMPPHTKDKRTIATYLLHMAEKLAARLRANQLEAQHFFIGIKSYESGWLGGKTKTAIPTNDSQIIFTLGQKLIEQHWLGTEVYQIQITALDPQPQNVQPDLFIQIDEKQQRLNQVIDRVNQLYGEFTLAPALLLKRTSMHNVIAPAWRPTGHRRSV